RGSDKVRVIELSHDAYLPLKAGEPHRIGNPLGGEQFERNHLVEQLVASPEDEAHVAADMLKNLVIGNDLPYRWCGGGHGPRSCRLSLAQTFVAPLAGCELTEPAQQSASSR